MAGAFAAEVELPRRELAVVGVAGMVAEYLQDAPGGSAEEFVRLLGRIAPESMSSKTDAAVIPRGRGGRLRAAREAMRIPADRRAPFARAVEYLVRDEVITDGMLRRLSRALPPASRQAA